MAPGSRTAIRAPTTPPWSSGSWRPGRSPWPRPTWTNSPWAPAANTAPAGPPGIPGTSSRVPGGSSSGSIVSVAAGYAPFALGTDTGGSVRLPASFCNVTALRPTYGVLSRFGVTAMASSLDQVGPVAASAQDLAAGLSRHGRARSPGLHQRGPARRASAWLDLQPGILKGLRIGLPKEYFGEGIDPGVRERPWNSHCSAWHPREQNWWRSPCPARRYAIDTYYLICTSEVSSNMSRFDGVRYGLRKRADSLHGMIAETRDQGFGPEVKRTDPAWSLLPFQGLLRRLLPEGPEGQDPDHPGFHGGLPQGGRAPDPRQPHRGFPDSEPRPTTPWPCTWPTSSRSRPPWQRCPACPSPPASRPLG